jgi:GGDEF domain-containing protein
MLLASILVSLQESGAKSMNRYGINDPSEFNFQNAIPLTETHSNVFDNCSNLTFFYDNLYKASLNISNIGISHFTETADGLLTNNPNNNLYTVLVLNIDKSGEINKLYDNSIPNELIAQIGSSLKNHIKAPNLYCNFNGKNFAVFLENYKSIDIALLVIQLTEEISGIYPEVNIRPAFGICTAGQYDQSFFSLYKRAFYAMTTIKGRDQQLLANYTELIFRKRKTGVFQL